MADRARLFVGIDAGCTVRARLALDWPAERCRELGFRRVADQNLHLTLRFLGDVDSQRVDGLAESLDATVNDQFPQFVMRASEIGAFPPKGRPRVLVCGTNDGSGTLASLAERCEAWAREQGFDAENRPFRAHITIGRAQRGGRAKRPEDGEAIDAETVVEDVRLYKSTLLPGGARYDIVREIPLRAIS